MNLFDTVRISSHGEFIDEDLYDSSINASSMNTTNNIVTFNIFFRGDIGHTVLVRCNTKDVYIDGNKYCSSNIGKSDFYKNMSIDYNYSGIHKVDVMGCETDKVPELELSFDTDDFSTGYALYDGDVPLVLADDECIKFKLFDEGLYEMKLKDVLEDVYNQLSIKSGSIDIYISACLYIEPSELNDIKHNYTDWYNCNVENIKVGYENELKDSNKKIEISEGKISICKNVIDEITRKNNDKHIKFYIDVLGNIKVKEGYGDYVYNYLISEYASFKNITDLDELINYYIEEAGINVDNTNDSDETIKLIADEISTGLSEKLKNKGETNSTIEFHKNELEKMVIQLIYYRMNNKDLIEAIKQCSLKETKPIIDVSDYSETKPFKSRLKRTQTIRPGMGSRYKPYGGSNKRSIHKIMKCLKRCKLKKTKKLTKKKKKKKKHSR